jgi:hypothetical protein
VQETLCGVWLVEVLVLRGIRVGVFFLVEVSKGVVYLAMLALIGTDCMSVSSRLITGIRYRILTVKQQVSH